MSERFEHKVLGFSNVTPEHGGVVQPTPDPSEPDHECG